MLRSQVMAVLVQATSLILSQKLEAKEQNLKRYT